MSHSESNKELISKAKELLKEKGYEVKTSHLYDIFAKLAGHKDWHVASAKDAPLASAIKSYVKENIEAITKGNVVEYIQTFFIKENKTHDEKEEFELFNPYLPAWNYSITGQTGSGKSVISNKILNLTMKNHSSPGKTPMVNIFSTSGDSDFFNFVTLFGGKTINFFNRNRPKIQLLELTAENSRPTPLKIKEMKERLLRINSDFTNVEEKILDFYDIKDRGDSGTSDMLIFKDVFEVDMTFEYHKVFTLKPGEREPSLKQLSFIMSIIELMISSDFEQLDGFQIYDPHSLKEYILQTYRIIGEKYQRYPQLGDLYTLLNEGITTPTVDKFNPSVRVLLEKIKKWTIGGEYPDFDQVTNLDMSNDILFFNFKGLEDKPQLQLMYSLVVNHLVELKMAKAKTVKIVVREDSELSRYTSYLNMLGQSLRVSRSLNCSTLLISQVLNDYLVRHPRFEKMILGNIQGHILSKITSEDLIRKVNVLLGLPQDKIDLASCGVIKRTDGVSQEMYLKFVMIVNNEIGVYKNYLNNVELWLYGSSAESQFILNYYLNTVKKFSSLDEVILFVAEKKHIGDKLLAAELFRLGFTNQARVIGG